LIARQPDRFVSLFPLSPLLLLALLGGIGVEVALLYAAWRWGNRSREMRQRQRHASSSRRNDMGDSLRLGDTSTRSCEFEQPPTLLNCNDVDVDVNKETAALN